MAPAAGGAAPLGLAGRHEARKRKAAAEAPAEGAGDGIGRPESRGEGWGARAGRRAQEGAGDGSADGGERAGGGGCVTASGNANASRRGGSRRTDWSTGTPALQYREGEPMNDLAAPGYANEEVEVRIPIESLSPANRHVHARQLWGAGPYSGDSDLVAAVLHAGCASVPPSTSGSNAAAGAAKGDPPVGGQGGGLASTSVLNVSELVAVVRPRAALDYYRSTTAHGIRSRAWGRPRNAGKDKDKDKDKAGEGSELATSFAFDVLRCYAVVSAADDKSGETRRVEIPCAPPEPPSIATIFAANQERQVHTRSRASDRDNSAHNGSDKRLRASQEVTVQYNLLNEPWLKYSLGAVADRGWKRTQWLSARMLEEVLYLETDAERYEIARNEPSPDAGSDGAGTSLADEDGALEGVADTYKVSRCKAPLLSNAETRRAGVPLPDSKVEVVHAAVTWEELQWAVAGMHLRGKFYDVARVHFARRKSPSSDAAGLALADAVFLGEMD